MSILGWAWPENCTKAHQFTNHRTSSCGEVSFFGPCKPQTAFKVEDLCVKCSTRPRRVHKIHPPRKVYP